ncbi:MAG: tRNA lysidine(34) synthetase TilS [Sulfurifustaceae bacterium]
MESTRKSESSRFGRRFTPAALAQVLTETLGLTPATPVYVAFSGGLDSHVLLHAAASLRRNAPWRVAALHVDHGLQATSAQWASHCAAVATALDVPYAAERIVVDDVAQLGLEDAARRARYRALARMLPAGAVLLTAHQQDDQAETLLLQLVRGAGPAGLAAMPAVTRFGRGRLARPLLGFARRELADYAAAQGLDFVEDASNEDERLARNYLRRRVWPLIAARWPAASERIALAARHQADVATLLDEIGRADLAVAADAEGSIDVSRLREFSPERRANLLRCWIRSHGVSAPAERVLRQILACVERRPATQQARVQWGAAEVRRYRDRLSLHTVGSRAPVDWEAPWDPVVALEIPGAGWRLRARATTGAGLARARIEGVELRVRMRRGGERLRVRGHSHKVKKLLQEAGIPPWERAQLPLIYVGDVLAAVGDRWVSDEFAACADEPGVMLVLERADAR